MNTQIVVAPKLQIVADVVALFGDYVNVEITGKILRVEDAENAYWYRWEAGFYVMTSVEILSDF